MCGDIIFRKYLIEYLLSFSIFTICTFYQYIEYAFKQKKTFDYVYWLLCKGGPETSKDVLNNFVMLFLFCAHFGYKVVTRKIFYYKGTFYTPFMQRKIGLTYIQLPFNVKHAKWLQYLQLPISYIKYFYPFAYLIENIRNFRLLYSKIL